jgi:uncharacterized protein
VDVGVHQDGLVHISALSNKFVKDPHTVIKAGDVVKVKILEVDEKRKRIALSMRLDTAPAKGADTQPRQPGRQDKGAGPAPDRARGARDGGRAASTRGKQTDRPAPAPRERPTPARDKAPSGAMAEALARALKRNQG